MATRCWNERRNESNQIIVHVPRVPERGRRSSHYSRHEWIELEMIRDKRSVAKPTHLSNRRIINTQSINGNPIQCSIVQHDHTIGVEHQTLERQQGIVRLNNNITLKVILAVHLWDCAESTTENAPGSERPSTFEWVFSGNDHSNSRACTSPSLNPYHPQ